MVGREIARQGGFDMKPFRVPLLVVCLTLTIGAVACSSGSTAKSASPAGRPADTGATPAATPNSGGSDAAFCADRNVANVGVDFDNADPADAVTSLQKAVALAPAEIKADVQTIADVDIPIFQGRVPEDQIDQRVSDPKVIAAVRHVATWSASHCR
jgi:hypothetical protein